MFAKNESRACVRSSSTVFYIFLVWYNMLETRNNKRYRYRYCN